jgi:predicted RNA binding protein YcfA (HicA-like mRNA interferase family)
LKIGCRFIRQEGDHRVWDRPDLIRPVIVRAKKDLPVFEIKSNLRTLRISTAEYLNLLEQM